MTRNPKKGQPMNIRRLALATAIAIVADVLALLDQLDQLLKGTS